MMQTLRKYMKYIFWVVAVAFVLTIVLSWGMGGIRDRKSEAQRGVIGIINGQKIRYESFAGAFEQEIEKTREESGSGEISDYQMNAVRDRIWQNLVQEVLLDQQVQKYQITLTPQEIFSYMRNNPPDFIQQNEQFQTDGKFDYDKYQQLLLDERNARAWLPLENYFRATVPIQKLQQWVVSTIRVTDGEIRDALRTELEKVNVRYLFFDPNRIPAEGITVTDSEIKEYFNQNKKNYAIPEKRLIEYIAFDLSPSRADSEQVYSDMSDILEELREGGDFAQLAMDNSDDKGSAEKGGDLGFFGRGAMVKEFEEAAFNAQVGELVGPVRTQFGLHVIKVTAKKRENGTEQVQASHILKQFKASPDTRDDQYENARSFYELVQEEGFDRFEKLALSEGYAIQKTQPFQKGGFLPGLGMVPRVVNAAFNEKKGWVSSPMTTDQKVIVFRISDVEKATYRDLEEVKPSIQRILENEKKKEKAGIWCRSLFERIRNGETLEAAAARDSLIIKTTGLFAMNASIPEIGKDPKWTAFAFGLALNEVSGPLEGEKGFYILEKTEHLGQWEAQADARLESKRQELLQSKRQMLFNEWFRNLRERAEIEDFRDEYY
ncbi:peptidylprolyl isomerase [bacterium]|nr:peptidylprolyl isomerase [bacterium]